MNKRGLIIAKYRGFPGFVQTEANVDELEIGAGSGNRTRIASLEGWCFTTKLYPLVMSRRLPLPQACRQAESVVERDERFHGNSDGAERLGSS